MGFIPETIRRELHGANIDLSGYDNILSVGTDDFGVGAIFSANGLVRYAVSAWPAKIRDRVQGNSNTQAFLGAAVALNALPGKSKLFKKRPFKI